MRAGLASWSVLCLAGCGWGQPDEGIGTLLWLDASESVPTVMGRSGGRDVTAPQVPGSTFPGPVNPQGTQVLLVSAEDSPTGHIEQLWLGTLDSDELSALSPPAGKVRNPVWSKDGSWVVFESDRESFRDLYRVSRFGQGLERLTKAPGGSFEPDVSEQGSVVFGSSRDGNAEIYRLNPDTGATVRLTYHPTDDVRPVWSPSGERVAWLSSRSGVPRVWLMGRSGADARPLRSAEEAGSDLQVRWSPTEDRLAVVTQRAPGSVTLTVYSVQGRVLWSATSAPVQEHPQWSKGGRWVAWTATTDGQSAVWIARSDGSEAQQVALDAWLPRWGS